MHHPLGSAIKLGWYSLRQRSNLRDAHLTISYLRSWKFVQAPASQQPRLVGTGMPDMQRCRRCEVPPCDGYFLETSGRCPHLVVKTPLVTFTLHVIDVAEMPSPTNVDWNVSCNSSQRGNLMEAFVVLSSELEMPSLTGLKSHGPAIRICAPPFSVRV